MQIFSIFFFFLPLITFQQKNLTMYWEREKEEKNGHSLHLVDFIDVFDSLNVRPLISNQKEKTREMEGEEEEEKNDIFRSADWTIQQSSSRSSSNTFCSISFQFSDFFFLYISLVMNDVFLSHIDEYMKRMKRKRLTGKTIVSFTSLFSSLSALTRKEHMNLNQ